MSENFGTLTPDLKEQPGTKYVKEEQAKDWEKIITKTQKTLNELKTEQVRLQAKGLDLDADDLKRMGRCEEIIARLQRLVKENREWKR